MGSVGSTLFIPLQIPTFLSLFVALRQRGDRFGAPGFGGVGNGHFAEPGPFISRDTFTSLCTHSLNCSFSVWSAPTYSTGHQQTVGGYRDTAPEPDAEQGKPLPTAPTPVPPVPTTTMPHTPSPRQPQPLTQTTAPPPPAGAFVI